MKIFIIILIIFVLVVIGLVKLNLVVTFNEKKGFYVFLKVFYLKFNLFSTEKKKSENEIKSEIKRENNKNKKSNTKKENKKNFFQTLWFIKILIKPIPKILKFLNRGLKIKRFYLNAKIAEESAKKTALAYVNFSKIIYIFLGFISSYCKLKEKKIIIKPDFLNEKSSFDFVLKMNISVARIVFAILIYLFSVIFKIIYLKFS